VPDSKAFKADSIIALGTDTGKPRICNCKGKHIEATIDLKTLYTQFAMEDILFRYLSWFSYLSKWMSRTLTGEEIKSLISIEKS